MPCHFQGNETKPRLTNRQRHCRISSTLFHSNLLGLLRKPYSLQHECRTPRPFSRMPGITRRRNQGILDLQQGIRRRGRTGHLDRPPFENGRHAEPTNGDGTTAAEEESVTANHQCPQKDRSRLLRPVRTMSTTNFRRPTGSFSRNSRLRQLRLIIVYLAGLRFNTASLVVATTAITSPINVESTFNSSSVP